MHTIATLPTLGWNLERRQTSTNTSSIAPPTTSSLAFPPTHSTSPSSVPTSSSTSSSSSPHTTTTTSSSIAAPIPTTSSSSSTTKSSTPRTTTTTSHRTPHTSTKTTSSIAPTIDTTPAPTQPSTSTPPATTPYPTTPTPGITYSSNASPTSLLPTLLGALTTTFTAPINCASPILSAHGTTSDYLPLGTTDGTTDIQILRSSCYPSHFGLADDVPTYSPGICPSGWSMHSYGISFRSGMPELTTAACCPSGATLSQSWQCIGTPVGTITTITDGMTNIINTNTYRPISNYIQVAWQKADCSLLPSGTCSREQILSPSPKPGLTSSTKIGIGVGVGVGGLLLIVGVVVGVLALRKRRKRVSSAWMDRSQRYSDYSNPPSYSSEPTKLRSNPLFELMSDRPRTELSADRE